MTTRTSDAADAIGRSLITATYAAALADMLSGLLDRIAEARRARASALARRRERRETDRIIASLPRELRADIGWRMRDDEAAKG